MSINYKTVADYRNQLRKFQNLIQSEDVFHEETQKLIIENQIAIATKQVDELPESYNKVLQENCLDREDLIFRIASTVFPLSTQANFKDNNELLEYMIARREFSRQLYHQFNDEFKEQFESIRDKLTFIQINDGNFLKKIFQSKALKEQIKGYQNSLERTFERISEINQILTPQNLEDTFKKDYIQKLDRSSRQKIADEIMQLTDLKNKIPENIIGDLAQIYFYKIKDRLAPIDSKSMDEKIEKIWEQRKNEKGSERLANTPISVLDHIEEANAIPKELIEYYGLSDMNSLKNLILSEIKYVVEPLNISAQEVRKAIFRVTDDLLENFYPRLDANNLSEADREMIDLIYQRQLITPDIEKASAKILTIIKKHEAYLKNVDATKNDYSSYIAQENTAEEQKVYFELLDELLIELDPLVAEVTTYTNKVANGVAAADLEDDFKNRSADYYALLDQITQQDSDVNAEYVPNRIVRLVKDLELDITHLKGRLRPYQDFGVKFALYFKRTLLGDEMGLGKTIQAIATAQHLYNHNKKHILMVGPLSILINWQREINQWTDIPTYLYRPNTRSFSYHQWKEHGGILITNYQQLGSLREQDLSFLSFIIIDEAHKVKNPKAKMSQNSKYVIDQSEYALLMTGTAIENRVDEMTQLIDYIRPDVALTLKRDFYTPTPEEYRTKASLVYLRRRRLDVLRELPEKEHIPLWSTFNLEQQQFYNEAVMAGVAGLQAMRYAAFTGDNKNMIEKIQQIIDICEEAEKDGNKVLIFSFFTNHVLSQIERFMGDKVVGKIDGSIGVAQRQQLIDDFSTASDGAVLLSQIDSGGVGLNIQAANIVIICEPQWKPSTESQAISRVFRMGQTKDVLVYHLLTQDSIDDSIVRVLNYKQLLFDQYADESEVAEAYEMSESKAKAQVLKIERERIKENRIKTLA